MWGDKNYERHVAYVSKYEFQKLGSKNSSLPDCFQLHRAPTAGATRAGTTAPSYSIAVHNIRILTSFFREGKAFPKWG